MWHDLAVGAALVMAGLCGNLVVVMMIVAVANLPGSNRSKEEVA